jgi:hypothetical protein
VVLDLSAPLVGDVELQHDSLDLAGADFVLKRDLPFGVRT